MPTITFPNPAHRISTDHARRDGTFIMSCGIVAGLVMTVLMAAARALGLTPFNFELYLGSTLLREAGPGAWLLGFITHLVLSALFALLYVVGFRWVQATGAWIGASFGVVQWLFVGLFLAVLPYVNVLVPEFIPPPGAFALNWGMFTFFFLMLVHLVYGAIVGDTYARYVRRYPEAWEPGATTSL